MGLRRDAGGKYKLEGHEVVLVEDLREWAEWFETADRVVAITRAAPIEVVTYFLGCDFQMHEGGRLLLFETQVIGGWEGASIERRYSSWAEAEAGHAEIVAGITRRHREAAEEWERRRGRGNDGKHKFRGDASGDGGLGG